MPFSISNIEEISCILINQTISFSKTDKIEVLRIQAAIIFTVTGLSFILNLMLIYGFYKTSRPFSIVTKLFICLSVWDVLTALGFAINAILMYEFDMEHQKNCLTLLIFFAFNRFQFFLGVDILLTISVLRFIALRWPFTRIRGRYVVYSITFNTLGGTVLAYIPLGKAIQQQTFDGVFKTAKYISSLLLFLVTCTFIINLLSYAELQRTPRTPPIQKDFRDLNGSYLKIILQ